MSLRMVHERNAQDAEGAAERTLPNVDVRLRLVDRLRVKRWWPRWR